MKTAREVLLERHARMETRLDAMRRAVVAEHVVPQGEPVRRSPNWSWLRGALDCFQADRWVWAVLAGCWVVIAALNWAPHAAGRSGSAEAAIAAKGVERQIALQEQARLRDELLGDSRFREPTAGSSVAPGPRTERAGGWLNL